MTATQSSAGTLTNVWGNGVSRPMPLLSPDICSPSFGFGIFTDTRLGQCLADRAHSLLDAILIARRTLCQLDSTAATARHIVSFVH